MAGSRLLSKRMQSGTQALRLISRSVWKPLQGPVTDWPLAVCDVSSVDRERDYVASDVVARPGFTENLQVYYNVSHKWFYLSKQLASEVIVFRQADTRPEFAIGRKIASCIVAFLTDLS